MEQLAEIFSFALPLFAVLVLGEKFYGHWKGNDTLPWMDAISSAYSGFTFLMRLLLGYGITIVSYQYMVEHLAIFHFETTWLTYVITFIVLDFQGYWAHRLSHEINVFWNRHLIHHSSEEYNLAVALRQTISDIVQVYFFLSIPAALLGLSAEVIATVLPVFTFAQYWYHTRQIGKLGFLEHIIVTPSHHRVHHAMNPLYLDKNYSAIFIIWDKLFGTFQEELESEPPVFGITRPSQTYNPITINFEHMALLIKDAWRAPRWADKLTIWFRPTGWRPEGFEDKYPVKKINDHHQFKKFNPPASDALIAWSLIQFFTLFFFLIYGLSSFSSLGFSGMYMMALLVLVQVYSATELMNRNKRAPLFSFISTLVCIGIYLHDPGFFGLGTVSAFLPSICLLYFVCQTMISFAFTVNPQEKLDSAVQ